MEAIKQIVKIPKDHEIKIKIPSYIPENEIVEVILIIKKSQDTFKQKISELKEAMKDDRFLDNLREVSEDFEAVDAGEYEQIDAELHAKIEAMPPGVCHFALHPLPTDVDAAIKAFIEKLEPIQELESLWAYKNPHNLRLWAVMTGDNYEADIQVSEAICEMMDIFPRNHIDYHWIIKCDRSEEKGIIPNKFVKVWERTGVNELRSTNWKYRVI